MPLLGIRDLYSRYQLIKCSSLAPLIMDHQIKILMAWICPQSVQQLEGVHLIIPIYIYIHTSIYIYIYIL